MDAMLHQRGGPVLVAVVSQPGGRFAAELESRHPDCAQLRSMLTERGAPVAAPGGGEVSVVGFAVLEAWRFVLADAAHGDCYAMMKADIAAHPRRSGQRFMEHRVLARGYTASAAPPSAWQHLPALVSGRDMLADAWDRPMFECRGDMPDAVAGQSNTVGQVVSRWRAAGPLSPGSACIAWPVCPPVATVLTSSRWYGDVTVHYRRAGGDLVDAGLGISSRLLHRFLHHPVTLSGPAIPAEPAPVPPRRGSCQPLPVERVVRSMQLGQLAGNMGKADDVLGASVQLLQASGRNTALCHAPADVKLPSRWSLVRARVQLDVAAMLMHRDACRTHGRAFRYLAFDASPQHGLEVFAAGERVVQRCQVGGGARPMVTVRRLPLTTLGVGRMGVADKLQALAHQTWLDYGPSVAGVRMANADVRQCLSDMGVEAQLVDCLDVLDSCAGPQRPVKRRIDETAGHMFPLALGVPGSQHLIDSCMRGSLEGMSWWPDWQRRAKIVCQWLQPRTRREFLASCLESAGGQAAGAPALVASLGKTCDRFADWRWQTLGKVCDGLTRMEDAVRLAVAPMTQAADLRSRDGPGAVAFLNTAKEDAFWEKAKMLRIAIRPMLDFAGWIKGCDCHEADLTEGRSVECPWKGCRAPSLGARLGGLLAELTAVRDGAADHGHLAGDVGLLASRLVSLARVKFNWVDQVPFLAWQLADRVVARQFLEQRDAEVCSGEVPHRVTEYFAGHGESSMRGDLEAYAGWRYHDSAAGGRSGGLWYVHARRHLARVLAQGRLTDLLARQSGDIPVLCFELESRSVHGHVGGQSRGAAFSLRARIPPVEGDWPEVT